MADHSDPSEIDYIEKKYSEYPSFGEMGRYCVVLGIDFDNFKTIAKDDAWAYYHELKAMVSQHKRKTA